jgi:hypothetical protein
LQNPRKRSGRDGFVSVPKELGGTIVGVFGLDNRPWHSGRMVMNILLDVTNPSITVQRSRLQS